MESRRGSCSAALRPQAPAMLEIMTWWPAACRMAVATAYWPAGCQSMPDGQLIPEAMAHRRRAVLQGVAYVMTRGNADCGRLIFQRLGCSGLGCNGLGCHGLNGRSVCRPGLGLRGLGLRGLGLRAL